MAKVLTMWPAKRRLEGRGREGGYRESKLTQGRKEGRRKEGGES